jgi:quinol monooxygenase YgiN
MTEIHGIARLKIHAGKLDEFKRLQTKCLEIVRAKDTGTLHYAAYFNSDETECIVHEHYRDSQALLDHFANLGDTAQAIFATCTASGELLGTPSPALRAALAGADVRIFTPYQAL